MACTNGKCSRCGFTHSGDGTRQVRVKVVSEEVVRAAERAEYFKKKKKYSVSKAQMRMFNAG